MCDYVDVVGNYREVDARVGAACRRAGRDRSEVTLVAVSKTKPDETVRDLASIGVRDFGENKPQELKRKHDEITDWPGHEGAEAARGAGSGSGSQGAGRESGSQGAGGGENLRWHMIGNIQTNKVKMFVGRACLIHSVPDEHIADAISAEAVKQGVTAHILIEVNIAGEATKHGLVAEDTYSGVKALVEYAAALPGLEVDGLMAIAPPVENPEENRGYFRQMRELRDRISGLNIDHAPLTELSMGMTGDFETAIEEGATIVRVGTAIFGARNYAI